MTARVLAARTLAFIALTIGLAAGATASAAAGRCGADPADAAEVSAVEAEGATVCDCCGFTTPARRAACVRAVAKRGAKTGTLAKSCVGRVVRDARSACTAPCALCSSDADCGAGEMCECRAGSCTASGGACVAKPQVCPDVAMPVCGCDGMTYGNDCERRAHGVCKARDGACKIGRCVDPSTGACTDVECSAANPCASGARCNPSCPPPPPSGGCFDTIENRCTGEPCSTDAPCRGGNQFCTPRCSPPASGCFDTIEKHCTGKPCSPDHPCGIPNQFCSTECPVSECQSDADCNDGNGCSADHCANGVCQHDCLCVGPSGGSDCCPGPAASCARPCGKDAQGVCGGSCATNEVCSASGDGCVCAPSTTTCGDTFPACDGSCPPGKKCGSLSGAPACQCIADGCTGGDGAYFSTCGDPVCQGHTPRDGVPPCTTEHVGDHCTCIGATCDPGDDCNSLLQCATSDPTHGGLCPISRRAYKKNVQYLSPSDLERLRADLLKFRLASYQYDLPGADPTTHLGFIIDDVGASPSVAANGTTVDLYGYASMAVAALQTQQREIDELKRELVALRAAQPANRACRGPVTSAETRRDRTHRRSSAPPR